MQGPKAIFLTGVAWSGKSTLMQRLLKYPEIQKVLSVTTRFPRVWEQEGVEYNFVSPKEFRKLKKSWKLLEHVLIHDSFYFWTKESDIKKVLKSGAYPIKNIDPVGMKIIEEDGKLKGQYICIFLDIPNEEMEPRIRANHPHLSDIEVEQKLKAANAERAVAQALKHCIRLDTSAPADEVFEYLKKELGRSFL